MSSETYRTRNAGEEKTYKLLKSLGFEKKDIKEPDKSRTVEDREPDFLISSYKIAIEVKNYTNAELIEENKKFHKELSTGKGVGFWAPVINKIFDDHLETFRRKLKKYPDHSSLLVEDFTDYSIRYPSIEFLIKGQTTVYFNKETADIVDTKYKEKSFRLDKNTEVGAVMFIFPSRILLYHNLMSEKNRVLPWFLWANNLNNVEMEHYVFFAPPCQETVVNRLEKITD
jgi:hypothetical protein